ncbi:MAG: FAD-dependent oxidoreductase [Leptotrichiaceae bacterium]|nr:FAD-dependent oxidoreductase [Leptotrichiaceae bacterium]MBP6280926.1 FAD-dependent oxidoreductase [Leptotrichiaceae bacterium]MBP7100591.1 FAD-dependent oxidoreductase [Leptotrichiaceae bacterium]MBP7739355.1 FAD-dependent oxidoreductase [Leptotrichiaceae bacterium]MBP9629343.1 FAD-dependent oxidoreductase [Leptotrichiaceae bacterium]
MKVVVVGCTHAGTAAIVNLKKLQPEAEITVFERNDNISFLSCGIALYVGGVVKDPHGLFYSSPEALEKLNVETKMKHNVKSVDIAGKKVKVQNIGTGEETEVNYDKLIVTTGSWPITPKIPGINSNNILLCKNYNHSNEIIEKSKNAKKIVIVGAGYIGVELVEAFRDNGKEVVLVDTEDRILSKYFDSEFSNVAEETLKQRGIVIATGEKVIEFKSDNGYVSKVVTNKNEYDADLVVMCVGFYPNTEIFKGQLDMLPNGAIKVDEYMKTSSPDVVAAGDCCTVFFNPSQEQMYIPLATNAVRMGTLAAVNICENKIKHPGTQGSSGIKIYEYNMAATGISEEVGEKMGLNVTSITIEDNFRPEFMPSYEKVTFKVVFDKDTREIKGAQLNSKFDLTQSINTLSVCIQNKMKVEDLAFVDFFFQPHYNKPWNFINLVGLESLK